jgi:hypothetical protein
MKEWEEQEVLIFFLPPYSPELNLIEILSKKDQVSVDSFLCLSQLSKPQRTVVVCAKQCGQTMRQYILDTKY